MDGCIARVFGVEFPERRCSAVVEKLAGIRLSLIYEVVSDEREFT